MNNAPAAFCQIYLPRCKPEAVSEPVVAGHEQQTW
jgi:hypothetical protein